MADRYEVDTACHCPASHQASRKFLGRSLLSISRPLASIGVCPRFCLALSLTCTSQTTSVHGPIRIELAHVKRSSYARSPDPGAMVPNEPSQRDSHRAVGSYPVINASSAHDFPTRHAFSTHPIQVEDLFPPLLAASQASAGVAYCVG